MMRHPNAALIAGYAVGELTLGPQLAVGVHLDGCAECRQKLRAFEEAEGALLEAMPDAPLHPEALQRAFARVAAKARASKAWPATTTAAVGREILPPSLLGVQFRPRRFVRPGVWVSHVDAPRHDGWRTYLLQAAPGLKLAPHSHSGAEYVSVISGAFEEGERYSAGDFVEPAPGADHRIRIVEDGPCLSLVTTHGRLELEGLSRLIGLALDI